MDFFCVFPHKKIIKKNCLYWPFNPDFILFSIKAVYRQSALPL